MMERRSPGFQSDLLQAIRELRKTQTRRIAKLATELAQDHTRVRVFQRRDGDWHLSRAPQTWTHPLPCPAKWRERFVLRPPHGQPGTVWALKEPLYRETVHDFDIAAYADGQRALDRGMGGTAEWLAKWKRETLASMFMPLWAARDFVTLKAVRVERLQEISEADAIAEGVFGPPQSQAGWRQYPYESCHLDTARESFITLWDSINGKKAPWESNPFVWVYEFGGYVREPGRPMPTKQGATKS